VWLGVDLRFCSRTVLVNRLLRFSSIEGLLCVLCAVSMNLLARKLIFNSDVYGRLLR
jgi:hypothetical protein